MKFLFPILLFVFSYSVTFADEDERKISIYIHPISLITSTAISLIAPPDEKIPIFLYITSEFPTSESSSIIVNPSLIKGSVENDVCYFRIGTGVGIRRYLALDPIPVFFLPTLRYLQLISSAHYRNVDKNNHGFMVDILGYIGYSFGISSFDIGFGYEYKYLKRSLEEKSFSYVNLLNKSIVPAVDINLNIRLPL